LPAASNWMKSYRPLEPGNGMGSPGVSGAVCALKDKASNEKPVASIVFIV